MLERDPISIADTADAMRDVDDVLMVVSAVLTADTADLTPIMRDALATVIRLGEDRIMVARQGVDDAEERLAAAESRRGRR